jgi:pimeloyl-ACP methyl ester carboxylesterase
MAYASSLAARSTVKAYGRQSALSHTAGTAAAYSFYGRLSEQPVDCNIYLPASYNPAGAVRFPVIYFCHGAASSSAIISSALASRVGSGIVQAIVVGYDAGEQSYYHDNVSGSNKARTKFADFRNWIEAHFLTYADPAWRAMCGFSMGGFGALTFAADAPEDYACCQVFAPPKIDWAVPPPPGSVWTADLVADLAPVESMTPYYKFTQNAARIKARGAGWLRMVCGTGDGGKSACDSFMSKLAADGFTATYELTDNAHNLGNYLDRDVAMNATDWKDFLTAKLHAPA